MPEFGFRPEIPLCNGRKDRTEIDLKLGNLLVEAKLTETGSQTAPAKMIDRYRDIDEVFDSAGLMSNHAVCVLLSGWCDPITATRQRGRLNYDSLENRNFNGVLGLSVC